jgi:hypothetical protein
MKSFYLYDRFELEQDILKISNVSDLIEEFMRQHIDGPVPFDEDELFNKLNGIKEVLEIQSRRLWDGFERMIETNQFINQRSVENE